MKKIIGVVCVFVISILLVGCSLGESKTVKLCKIINEKIDEFTAGKMTFDELYPSLQSAYSDYCPDEENRACTIIKDLDVKKMEVPDSWKDDPSSAYCKMVIEADSKSEAVNKTKATYVAMECTKIIDES